MDSRGTTLRPGRRCYGCNRYRAFRRQRSIYYHYNSRNALRGYAKNQEEGQEHAARTALDRPLTLRRAKYKVRFLGSE